MDKVLRQPVLADYTITDEAVAVDHHRMAQQQLVGNVIVAFDPVVTRAPAALVPAGIAHAVLDKLIVEHHVEPRYPLPIRARHAVMERSARGRKLHVLAIGPVKKAHKLVIACFGACDRPRTEIILDPAERFTPVLPRLQHRMERSRPVIEIEHIDRSEDIDEVMCRPQVRLDPFEVSPHERHDVVRPPTIALRPAIVVQPRLDRLAVFHEGDVVIAVAGRVGIEIDVVIVQAPRDVLGPADLADLEHILDGPHRRVRRVDIRQAVIVAPPLPDMQGQQTIGQAVIDQPLHRLGDLGVSPAPDIKHKPPRLASHARRGLLVIHRPIPNRAVERAFVAGHKGQRRVIVRVQRVHLLLRGNIQVIRRIVRRHKQRQAVVELETHMTGRQIVPPKSRAKGLRLDDAVTVAVIDLLGRTIERASRQVGDPLGAVELDPQAVLFGNHFRNDIEWTIIENHRMSDLEPLGRRIEIIPHILDGKTAGRRSGLLIQNRHGKAFGPYGLAIFPKRNRSIKKPVRTSNDCR